MMKNMEKRLLGSKCTDGKFMREVPASKEAAPINDLKEVTFGTKYTHQQDERVNCLKKHLCHVEAIIDQLKPMKNI